MKISDVLGYMQLEYSLRGDKDYNNQISLSDLDIDWISLAPSDNDFHAAATACREAKKIQNYSQALQEHLDKQAYSKGYDNGFTLATYINSNNATWAQEAADFIAWRDACWQYAYNVQTQVEGGQDAPTIENFIANAPELVWNT